MPHDLDSLLRREGLAPKTRLLALGLVAIWRGDWPRLRAAAKAGQDGAVPRAAFEEMLLQAVLFCGFPRVVTAFEHLGQQWPAPTPPSGGGLPRSRQEDAGRLLFDRIYRANAEAVRTMLQSFHADFCDFVFEVAYGRILSRPGLSPLDRELLAVAALAAADQPRQFSGHARGALHCGADREMLAEVLVTIFGEGAEAEAWLVRIPSVGPEPKGPGQVPGD